jgi:hypothetical protein
VCSRSGEEARIERLSRKNRVGPSVGTWSVGSWTTEMVRRFAEGQLARVARIDS